jgi:hypothetical protein
VREPLCFFYPACIVCPLWPCLCHAARPLDEGRVLLRPLLA